MTCAVPYLGHGVGLRPTHFPWRWDGTARVDSFEDDHIPELDVVCTEAERARAIEAEVIALARAVSA